MILSGFTSSSAFYFFVSEAFFDAAFDFDILSLACLDLVFLRLSLPLTVFDILFFLSFDYFVSLFPYFVFFRIAFILFMFKESPVAKFLIIFYLKELTSLYRPILLSFCST
jgi:hypothetical protein